jgi:RNA polymerase sigma factor (sigma-70 family)
LIHSDEKLFCELYPTITAIYKTVSGNSPKYTLEDAKSDAWAGYEKAKKRDNLAPSIADTTIECPECENEMHMPEIMENDETADPSSDRTFDLECDSCHHKWQKTIKKVQFSTCVYSYIRGEIQRGARESRRCGMQKIKKRMVNGCRVDPAIISIDVFSQTSNDICNAISVDQNVYDLGISAETKRGIHQAVSRLPDRQCEVISRMFGLEYNGEMLGQMTQAQVADFLGITRQRICAIVSSALIKLKKELKELYEA